MRQRICGFGETTSKTAAVRNWAIGAAGADASRFADSLTRSCFRALTSCRLAARPWSGGLTASGYRLSLLTASGYRLFLLTASGY